MKYWFSIFLAFYACFGWGVVTPLILKMKQSAGAETFHPLTPYLWNIAGNILILIPLLLFTYFYAPIKTWTWHWSGWALAWFWPSAGLAFTGAIYLASGRETIPNVVAASYPLIVSATILWYFFGEPMTLQKLIGLILVTIGLITAILAK